MLRVIGRVVHGCGSAFVVDMVATRGELNVVASTVLQFASPSTAEPHTWQDGTSD